MTTRLGDYVLSRTRLFSQFKQVLSIPSIVCAHVTFVAIPCRHPPGIAIRDKPGALARVRLRFSVPEELGPQQFVSLAFGISGATGHRVITPWRLRLAQLDNFYATSLVQRNRWGPQCHLRFGG